MTEATPEQIAMARRIAEQCNPGLHRVSGDLEAVALAAIIETQRLCAEVAETIRGDGLGTPASWAGWNNAKRDIATAIRAGKHYGKDTDQ